MAGQTQTMQEGLNKLLAEVAQMMILPDADIDFLSQIQMAITQYVKQGQGGSTPGQQSAVPGGAGTQPTTPQPPPGMMTGGASMGMGAPNVDEMRRMLATQMGGQGG